MFWDNELEKSAQVWADRLRDEDRMGHDPNLGDVRYLKCQFLLKS